MSYQNKGSRQVLSYKDQQKQEQAEIQYYIYQDLQNLINLIYSRNAVIEYFKDDPTNEMVTQCNNKLILQLNLSRSIHFDQTQYSKKDQDLMKFLYVERKKAYNILEQFIPKQEIKKYNTSNQRNNDQILKNLQEYREMYEKQAFTMDQYPLLQTKQESQFNETVIQSIISQIQTVDFKINEIRNNRSYDVPTKQVIEQKAKQFKQFAENQLKQNFSNQNLIKDKGFTNIGTNYQETNPQQGKQDKNKKPSLNIQQSKQYYDEDKFIEFINYSRYYNPSICYIRCFNLNPKSEDQHYQLINSHYYFYLFTEYQSLIQKYSQYRKTDIELYQILIDNEKKETISLYYLCEYLFNQKQNIANIINKQQNLNQDPDFDLYSLFQKYYHSHPIQKIKTPQQK